MFIQAMSSANRKVEAFFFVVLAHKKKKASTFRFIGRMPVSPQIRRICGLHCGLTDHPPKKKTKRKK
ncbi:MAG: hypothetical protein QM657_18245, partial [Lacrimispora sp.]|uniref:hypothetical protein n=1 Tax=Lacrimispora sp. TaxID=2719234 RepID=UPI0039E36555